MADLHEVGLQQLLHQVHRRVAQLVCRRRRCHLRAVERPRIMDAAARNTAEAGLASRCLDGGRLCTVMDK